MTNTESIEQHIDQVKTRVEQVLSLAKQLGADGAEVAMSRQQGVSVNTRLGDVETVEYTNDGALGITVYKGGCKGSASTADLSEQALKDTVAAAINIAKYTSVDSCAGLADKNRLAVNPPDLKLHHKADISTAEAIEIAKSCEAAALATDTRLTNSDGANFSAYEGFKVYGNSHGFIEGYPSSRYSLSCVMIATDKDDMQRDYAYSVNRQMSLLDKPELVGVNAANEVLARLHSRKIGTTKAPVLFRADIANSLFGHLVAAISGGNLYRKSSFLVDALGAQILPEHLTIAERPHLISGLASSPFDAEGVATIDRNIIESGILSSFLLTSYSARKLGMETTGHAGGIHNWLVSSNGGDLDAMLAALGTGLLVTELMGQGVNVVTGDYSRGAAGFWVENGKIAFPVSEITIAGNLKDIFKNMVLIGSDIELRGSIQTGSVLIESMQIAGE